MSPSPFTREVPKVLFTVVTDPRVSGPVTSPVMISRTLPPPLSPSITPIKANIQRHWRSRRILIMISIVVVSLKAKVLPTVSLIHLSMYLEVSPSLLREMAVDYPACPATVIDGVSLPLTPGNTTTSGTLSSLLFITSSLSCWLFGQCCCQVYHWRYLGQAWSVYLWEYLFFFLYDGLEAVYCPSEMSHRLIFPDTRENQNATIKCAIGYEGGVVRKCLAKGVWDEVKNHCRMFFFQALYIQMLFLIAARRPIMKLIGPPPLPMRIILALVLRERQVQWLVCVMHRASGRSRRTSVVCFFCFW